MAAPSPEAVPNIGAEAILVSPTVPVQGAGTGTVTIERDTLEALYCSLQIFLSVFSDINGSNRDESTKMLCRRISAGTDGIMKELVKVLGNKPGCELSQYHKHIKNLSAVLPRGTFPLPPRTGEASGEASGEAAGEVEGEVEGEVAGEASGEASGGAATALVPPGLTATEEEDEAAQFDNRIRAAREFAEGKRPTLTSESAASESEASESGASESEAVGSAAVGSAAVGSAAVGSAATKSAAVGSEAVGSEATKRQLKIGKSPHFLRPLNTPVSSVISNTIPVKPPVISRGAPRPVSSESPLIPGLKTGNIRGPSNESRRSSTGSAGYGQMRGSINRGAPQRGVEMRPKIETNSRERTRKLKNLVKGATSSGYGQKGGSRKRNGRTSTSKHGHRRTVQKTRKTRR